MDDLLGIFGNLLVKIAQCYPKNLLLAKTNYLVKPFQYPLVLRLQINGMSHRVWTRHQIPLLSKRKTRRPDQVKSAHSQNKAAKL
jgi:hypothetical protein